MPHHLTVLQLSAPERTPVRFALHVALLCLLLPATALLADDFSDFHIPPHRLYTVTGSASGTFFNTRYQDISYTGMSYGPHSYRLNNLEGAVQGRSLWLLDSDSLRESLSLQLNATGQKRGNYYRNEVPSGDIRHRTDQSSVGLNLALSEDMRVYPSMGPWGLFGAFEVSASSSGEWNHFSVDETRSASVSIDGGETTYRTTVYDASLDFGFGFGRVRDVTAVYDVHVLAERLAGAGALRAALSRVTRQKLTDLFYTGGYYRTVHDRADKFFWRDVQSILQADSAVARPLDAYSLYRIAEGYLEPAFADTESGRFFPGEELQRFDLSRSRFFRQNGFFVGPIVRASASLDGYKSSNHRHYEVQGSSMPGQNYSYQDGYDDWSGDYTLRVGGRAEYHRPYGTRWQVDLFSSMLSASLEGNSGWRNMQVQNEAHAAFMVTDRWRADMLFRHEGEMWAGSWNGYWKTNTSLGVTYYIEDHLSLSLAAMQLQGHHTWLGAGQPSDDTLPYTSNATYSQYPEYQRVYRITAGVSYHFFGSLDIPGVAATEIR
ncbi:MAG TPA: hypothetical protein VGL38_07540 [bacterium]